MFATVDATDAEKAAPRPGDERIQPADIVMDRAFTVSGDPAEIWPWVVQLGKGRAGWYLPRAVERIIPASRRAIRHIEPRWQDLQPEDVIPDYGGRHETFTVAAIRAPTMLVYRSRRGHTEVTWAISLDPVPVGSTRIHLRLRLAPVRHQRLARTAGGFVDALTIAGLAAGLRERLAEARAGSGPT